MPEGLHAVFGGTGFLGRRIVRHLLDRGERVRVATRHPERVNETFSDCPALPESVRADVRVEASIAAALEGADGAVNAVSLYVEKGDVTFQTIHVDAAQRVARCAHAAGIERFAHVSGIGSDAESTSPYIRSRGEGERAVRGALPSATILRSAVMFGPGDSFLTPLIAIVKRAPVIPLFGNGDTQLEPAYVQDVGEAAARILLQQNEGARLYELGGPERFRYRELLALIAKRLDRQRVLVPVPFAAWQALGWFGELLPGAPLTRNQVELMREDNVASPALPGFGALGIAPTPIGAVFTTLAGEE
ncbi:MAG: complex I NDUFA9 subunit family protein [Xanthobacteraceae bacterium]